VLNFTSILFAITVVAALTSLDSDSAFQEAAPMQPVESQGDYAPQIPVYNTSSKESIAQLNKSSLAGNPAKFSDSIRADEAKLCQHVRSMGKPLRREP
jgi:hypothetical protein